MRPFVRTSRLAVSGALALCCLLSIAAQAAPAITRGPFLQLGDEQGVTVVWHSDVAVAATLRYGASPTALTSTVQDAQATTVHVMRIAGLAPSTRYFYSLHSGTDVLASGSDYSFRTHPARGAQETFRFIAFGDSGTAGSGQRAVADRMAQLGYEPAFGLILGDIVYPAGERANYDPRYFQPYAPMLRRMVVWPTIGNHDVGTDNGDPYLENFYLPTNNPQNSELYYSFDYGNAHFVCLDTHRSSFSSGSAQLKWLQDDLAASTAKWKFVYFHVPPYSGGTHADSNSVKSNILPLLEAAGVDVVFTGHSHVYERTYLLKNHTIVDGHANTYDHRDANGTVYVVSGTAGQSGALADPSHPLMAFQKGNTLGASIVEVQGPLVRGYFLDSAGAAHDLFTIFKSDDVKGPRLVGVKALSNTQLQVSFDEPVSATATNVSNYAITPAVAVQGATLQSDRRTVLLTTAAHAGGSYRLGVSNVRDAALPSGNLIDPASSATYTLPGTLVPRAGPWRYRVFSSTPPASWAEVGFDDASWSSGQAPIGYGESNVVSTVPSGTLAVFARTAFLLPDPTRVAALWMDIAYDDGFVAFLNGAEIARRNVPANQTHTTAASSAHEASADERVDLASAIAQLRSGQNVLAVQVHNVNTTSSDLVLAASLTRLDHPPPPPYLVARSPLPDATQVDVNAPITATVRDDVAGLDPSGIRLTLNDELVTPTLTGTPNQRELSFSPIGGFGPATTVRVSLDAENAGGEAMATASWSFVTRDDPVLADAGSPDAGSLDGGSHDAGALPDSDAGVSDGGSESQPPEEDPSPSTVDARAGCGCTDAGSILAAGCLLLLSALRRRRSTRV